MKRVIKPQTVIDVEKHPWVGHIPQNSIEAMGEPSLAALARKHKIPYDTIRWRYRRGFRGEQLITASQPLHRVEGKTFREWAQVMTNATGRKVTADQFRLRVRYRRDRGMSCKKAVQSTCNAFLKQAVRDGLDVKVQPRDDI